MLQELPPSRELQAVLSEHFGKLIVIVFYGDWSKQSIRFKETLQASLPLFGQFDNVVYLAASAERNPDAFKAFNVAFTPTVLFTNSLKNVTRKFQTEDAAVVLDALVEESQLYRASFQKEERVWFGKINNIITESPVVLFTLESSFKSGKSSAILQLLKQNCIIFTPYDIADGNHLSHWLKHYSHATTFPQVFVGGKFIGDAETCIQLSRKVEFLGKIPKSNLPVSCEQKLKELISSRKVLVVTDKFINEGNEIESLLTTFKLSTADVSVYNVQIDKKMHEYVSGQYLKKYPLIFIQGKLSE